jgi:hypothetical protein
MSISGMLHYSEKINKDFERQYGGMNTDQDQDGLFEMNTKW